MDGFFPSSKMAQSSTKLEKIRYSQQANQMFQEISGNFLHEDKAPFTPNTTTTLLVAQQRKKLLRSVETFKFGRGLFTPEGTNTRATFSAVPLFGFDYHQ